MDKAALIDVFLIETRLQCIFRQVTPSELEVEAQRLVAEGKMPSLETLLQAIAETREKYVPLIVVARKESNDAE